MKWIEKRMKKRKGVEWGRDETDFGRERERWNLYSQFSDLTFTSQSCEIKFTSQLPNDQKIAT